jgi:hypothetical protein
MTTTTPTKDSRSRRREQRRTNFRIADDVRQLLDQHFTHNQIHGKRPTGWQELFDLLIERYVRQSALK